MRLTSCGRKTRPSPFHLDEDAAVAEAAGDVDPSSPLVPLISSVPLRVRRGPAPSKRRRVIGPASVGSLSLVSMSTSSPAPPRAKWYHRTNGPGRTADARPPKLPSGDAVGKVAMQEERVGAGAARVAAQDIEAAVGQRLDPVGTVACPGGTRGQGRRVDEQLPAARERRVERTGGRELDDARLVGGLAAPDGDEDRPVRQHRQVVAHERQPLPPNSGSFQIRVAINDGPVGSISAMYHRVLWVSNSELSKDLLPVTTRVLCAVKARRPARS